LPQRVNLVISLKPFSKTPQETENLPFEPPFKIPPVNYLFTEVLLIADSAIGKTRGGTGVAIPTQRAVQQNRREGEKNMNENLRRIGRWTGKHGGLAWMLALALTAGFIIGNGSSFFSHTSGSVVPTVSAGRSAVDAVTPGTSFAPIVKNALPAVVSISASKVVKADDADEGLSPLFNDPMFRQFFGQRPRGKAPEQRERGLGSGVIINPDGYILTNNHVIDGATDVKIYLNDKRELKARLIGTDPRTDIAVLKVEQKNLPALPIGNSSEVQVGDLALAIGDPFGVGKTVTMGIVSATGRGNLGIEDYEDFIQTDAAINPGNSGGALINTRSELIGINTAILSGGGGNQGIGFAVPVNMARNIMDQILKNGKVSRGYLGVMIQEVTPQLAKAFNLADANGALIGEVTADGPAARAGIVQGDVVTELNGEKVTDSRALRLKISQFEPGTIVRLKLMRDGKEREVNLTLGELPNEKPQIIASQNSNDSTIGLSVETLTPQIAQHLELKAGIKGVVITEVREGSAAAEAGLRRGDVIQEINRKAVTNLADFQAAMKQGGDQSVLLLINRDGRTSYVVISAQ